MSENKQQTQTCNSVKIEIMYCIKHTYTHIHIHMAVKRLTHWDGHEEEFHDDHKRHMDNMDDDDDDNYEDND